MIHRLMVPFSMALACCLSCVASAADHYVRVGAEGSGASWADAMGALPSELIRGDTYYIADGSYDSYQCDDPVSGTEVITVKKATIDDHGTDTGWDDSYGDGQATFNRPLNFKTPNWIWDGMKGSGRNPDDYGFRVVEGGDCADLSTQRMVGIPPVGSMVPISNVRFSHTAVVCCGAAHAMTQICLYSNPESASGIVISHNYFKDGAPNMLTRKWQDSFIEHNYFDRNWSSPTHHGEQVSPGGGEKNVTYRYNVFRDSEVFVIGFHIRNNSGYKIYGNVVVGGNIHGVFVSADSAHLDVLLSSEIYNNSIINVNVGARGIVFTGPLTDSVGDKSYAYNNLAYNCDGPKFSGSVINDYNAFFDCTGTVNEEAHSYIASGNPFQDIANDRFELIMPTPSGKSDLGEPFTVDPKGDLRGADGIWDAGAYELELPKVPTNLRILE
jgi:hypothetical protein